ncbi:M15 family metallopeptidase [Pararhizobium sp.]|uniref:M15 family metallopeptidase n=1 Tax=Pararhizobium sp. TaxID=1977563 RepID=UPI0027237738|nr:M15 family metallopeptidase [Pararhizobium sp.]MDO9418604.1 M15 family metallopeptidase [Pararhizobium sp.]
MTGGIKRIVLAMSLAAAIAATATAAEPTKLPEGFVYLRQLDPSIPQDIRYFGSHNFLGRRVAGYDAAECILTRKAAIALQKIQRRLKPRGLSLKVYDCYRPAQAVADFARWASRPGDEAGKTEFYPTLDKSHLFALGYIAKRSGHSRGSSVDLTIVPLPARADPASTPEKACHLPAGERYADNSLDFGTGYDCFHDRSHTQATRIGREAQRNRALLVAEMANNGFVNYKREWWHFSLKDEPFPKTHFDFPISAPAD